MPDRKTKVPRRDWTRTELLQALRLYTRFPFGRLHRQNPEIIALAARIGGTPNAVAMKACNFASLDPAITSTGCRGLTGRTGRTPNWGVSNVRLGASLRYDPSHPAAKGLTEGHEGNEEGSFHADVPLLRPSMGDECGGAFRPNQCRVVIRRG